MRIIDMIHMANENEWKTCMYGLGKIGQNYGYEFLYYYGIEPDLFGDRDEQVLNKFDCSLDKKIAFEELIKTEDHILVFVTVGFAYEKEIIEQLSINPKIHIITWTQICNDSLALKRFLQIENFPNKKNNKKQLYEYTMGAGNKHNEKIAVYTCITGNYDYPLEILNKEDRCDYFLISDLKEGTNMVNEQYYRRINTSKVVPKEYITAKDKNRYCKMHGYKIFSDYDYSIYIDGNLQIIGKISEYIDMIGKSGLALHKHPFSEDVYSEAVRQAVAGRITKDEAKEISKWMVNNGVPRYILYLDCNVIVSNHNNPNTKMIMENWSKYYFEGNVKRDQFYMSYVLWKNGIDSDDVGIIPGNVDNSCYVKRMSRHNGIQR